MKEAPRVSFDVNSCGDEHPCGEYLVFPEITFHKVLVIGLGQLGLPVAKYIKERGFDVYGYDISTKALERAEKIAGIKKAINFSGFDVYIICVSTHKQEDIFSPQIELNSSKSIKSKIIQAAIQVDAEYRMYRIINKSYQLTTEATKYVGLRETTCQSAEQVHPPGKSLPNLVSARLIHVGCIHK